MSFSIHSVYRLIFRIWRARRFDLFKQILRPGREESLLDVGGYPAYWTSHEPVVARIDTLNVHEVDFDSSAYPGHAIRAIVGDGCSLEFPDESYDIVYSNSVIEHLSTWENQKRFASELRRVGRKLWCQTPALECPIEPHYLALFVHWLPKVVQQRILRCLTPWGLITRPTKKMVMEAIETTRLISRQEMGILFPDCEIRVEYLLPFVPKSYIAIRGAPNRLADLTVRSRLGRARAEEGH